MRRTSLPLIVVLTAAATPIAAGQEVPADNALTGHSAHGAAFDEGPRQKPWRMEGIGETHFPITTSVPEVQAWFDQGNTLLHNFWYFEAERAFRWCLKLDPDCAMAYWGLARCIPPFEPESERRSDFLKEAVRRKDAVTERERKYIEAFAKAYLPEYADETEADPGRPMRAFETIADELEMIVLEHPDDVEAKALFVLYSLYRSSRYGNEAILQEIFREAPEHPGAHHYRIHNWDGREGAVASDSCDVYGRIAWYSGHANHMPGHIYSGIGMWHEGAIWMDSATRVEKRYMERRMTLPYHNWNYAHNRNYLSFIQEQLGLPSMALDGARQLMAAPLDPEYNDPAGDYSVHGEGVTALARGLIKFERWDEILEEGAIPWQDAVPDRALRAYAEALAHLARGEHDEAVDARAALRGIGGEIEKLDPWMREELQRVHSRMLKELDGRMLLARGDGIGGLRLLTEAAEEQHGNYREENDPPWYPYLLYTVVGEHHLDLGSPRLAAECFERTLEANPNDAFALSGLARARHATGDPTAAAEAYGRLLHVWSDAEPGLRWLESVRSLGLDATPVDRSPRPQRNYRAQSLDQLGPETWRPYAAPALDALDPQGKRVTLEEYKGRNVLLVFYLGEGCVHCVEQLQAIGKKAYDFGSRDVALLAISSQTPEQNARSLELGELPFRLLADRNHENARRFHSYDDFEELELHSTILIDGRGRIRWARTGGDPFMELDFLLEEIDRVNAGADLVGSAADTAETIAGRDGR
ncbi:MAG: redoxin domain-containing protein [Planctomycetota bacterium]|jgi:peroxiredoxin